MLSTTIKRQSVLERIDKRWLGAGLAVAGSVAATQATEAAIVWSGPVGINIPSTTSGIYLNVATGVSATTPAGASGWDINPWGSTTWNVWANNAASVNDGVVNNFTGGSSTTLVDNLPSGTLINGSWTYGRTNGVETTGPTAFVFNSSNNCIGFRFLNEADGQLHFGTAHIQLGASAAAQPRTILDYAWESTAGAGITACAPEPTSIALLALGALGLTARRRRNA